MCAIKIIWTQRSKEKMYTENDDDNELQLYDFRCHCRRRRCRHLSLQLYVLRAHFCTSNGIIHFYNKDVVTVIFSYHQRHHSNHCCFPCHLCVTKAIQFFIWICSGNLRTVLAVVVQPEWHWRKMPLEKHKICQTIRAEREWERASANAQITGILYIRLLNEYNAGGGKRCPGWSKIDSMHANTMRSQLHGVRRV